MDSNRDSNNTPSWEELLGSKKWRGMIEPELNLSLREFILRCGDMCEATYDAFNSTPESPRCGDTLFGMDNFFRDVMLKEASRYQLVSFLYATAGIGSDLDKNIMVHSRSESEWDHESNWFGYVAVTNDEVSRAIGRREVYVAWRGTITTAEWGSNIFGASQVPATPLFSDAHNSLYGGFLWWAKPEPCCVHEGWLKIYTTHNSRSNYSKSSARVQLHNAIQEIRNRYKGEKLSIVVTGHSLGGALATLSGFDLAENDVAGGGRDVLISVITFGSPQVGNEAFRDYVLALPNINILQVFNDKDSVPMMPDGFLSFYVPIATAMLEVDTDKSPYLLWRNVGDYHNLQGNLHVVAGWNGRNKPFQMRVKRSLALVNKASGFLNPDLKIPEGWWNRRHKGIRYDEDNDEWIFDSPPPTADTVKPAS